MDDPELSGGTEDVVKIDLEMDDAEEPRSLAEFFPARFDEKIGDDRIYLSVGASF